MKWRSIISFHFTRVRVHEVTQLEKLLEPIWEIGDVYADSGYLSANNCWVIRGKGGIPYIRPKKTTKPKRKNNTAFSEMIENYFENTAEWMKKISSKVKY